jgi:hypothetical protein
MMTVQNIIKNDLQLIINGISHELNTDFFEVVDSQSVHISLDSNKNIRIFECAYTIINGETAQTAEGLLSLFGLIIE